MGGFVLRIDLGGFPLSRERRGGEGTTRWRGNDEGERERRDGAGTTGGLVVEKV